MTKRDEVINLLRLIGLDPREFRDAVVTVDMLIDSSYDQGYDDGYEAGRG